MSLRALLRWVLPFVVSACILAWLLTRYDLGEVMARVGAPQAGRLLVVLVAYVALSLWIEALTLARLARTAGTPARARTCAQIKAASYPFLMLHYLLGGAVLTVLLRRRLGLGLLEALGFPIAIAIFDLAVLLLLTSIGAAFVASEAPALRFGVIATAAAGIPLGLFVLRAPFPLGPLERLRQLELFRVMRTAPARALAEVGLLRFVFVLLFVGLGAGSMWAFDLYAPLADLIVGLAAAGLVGALPIAVSGLGTVQATIIYMFREWGDQETLLACSLAMSFGLIAMRAVLGLIFAREFTREAIEAARAAGAEA